MAEFGLTMPLKVHIIVDHLSEYFELEGSTLRNTNGQFIEACHAKIKKVLWKPHKLQLQGQDKNVARLSMQQLYNSTVITLAVYNLFVFPQIHIFIICCATLITCTTFSLLLKKWKWFIQVKYWTISIMVFGKSICGVQPPENWLKHYFCLLLFTCPEQCDQ